MFLLIDNIFSCISNICEMLFSSANCVYHFPLATPHRLHSQFNFCLHLVVANFIKHIPSNWQRSAHIFCYERRELIGFHLMSLKLSIVASAAIRMDSRKYIYYGPCVRGIKMWQPLRYLSSLSHGTYYFIISGVE